MFSPGNIVVLPNDFESSQSVAEESESLDFPKNYRMRIKREAINEYSRSSKPRDSLKVAFQKANTQNLENKLKEALTNGQSKPRILIKPG